jgi:hypothetical protein
VEGRRERDARLRQGARRGPCPRVGRGAPAVLELDHARPPGRSPEDGPYADTKEQIGGTFVIDVPDLDAALAWAEKHPAAQWGTIEIRPSAVRYADGSWRTA